MLETVHAFIDQAAKQLNIPSRAIEKLKKFNKEYIFDIKLDSGKTYKAYRVQHNNKLGPYKGGVRFHKDVNLEEIRALAILMSLKTAAAGLPMGGAKGGVAVDPHKLTNKELEELARKYVAQLQPHIGPDKDIPAPDVNTNPTIIDWMVDEYERLTGDKSRASFTGKSLKQGGSQGREAATGRGGVVALAELLKLKNENSKTISYAVQGYGNVGSFFGTEAQFLHPNWKLIAASDSQAAVYSANGLDAKQLKAYKEKGGRFSNYSKNVSRISNDAMLALQTDVLVLAGLEEAITKDNMAKIKARYIVEMANGPITGGAYEYLSSKSVTILPDVVANAGGVIVSYLEWLQNKKNENWTEDKVNQHMEKQMIKAVHNMYHFAKANKIDLKQAALAIAIKRLTT